MKLSKFTNILVIGLTLTLAASGCRKRPLNTTPLYGQRIGNPNPEPPSGPVGGNVPIPPTPPPFSSDNPIPSNPPREHEHWIKDATIFNANTVHFAFDSSVVKDSDKANVAAVADYLKGHAGLAVSVEGHCDERGTAGYNQALGERRAQAVRTALVGLGIDATRVDTISYGFDRPVDPGHDESAWSKNRRAEFILLTPPK